MHLLLTSFGVIGIKEPKSEPILIKKFGEDAETCAKYIKSLETEIKTKKEFEKEIKEFLVTRSPERILTNHSFILELIKKHFQESISVYKRISFSQSVFRPQSTNFFHSFSYL